MSQITWLHDVSPAAWLAARIHPFGQDVGSVVPAGFAAYCRIFHPVLGSGERWSDVARRNGRVVHPEMQFHMIGRPVGMDEDDHLEGSRDRPPDGSFPLEQRRVLVDILRSATTSTARCGFCMWDGWGDLDDGGVSERVELPGRSYLFYAGPIETALSFPPKRFDNFFMCFSTDTPLEDIPRLEAEALEQARTDPRFADQSPNLWWPGDRAWTVATEVDHAWTYVGGTPELIDRILGEPRLEALPATVADQFFQDSDRVNAALDDG